MNLPHWRVPDSHAFDEDVFTMIRLYELRPQIMAFAENSLAHRYAAFCHVCQSSPRFSLVPITFFPTILSAPVPRPPRLIVGLAIQNPRTGDSDVLLLEGVDERRIVHQLRALPASEYQR